MLPPERMPRAPFQGAHGGLGVVLRFRPTVAAAFSEGPVGWTCGGPKERAPASGSTRRPRTRASGRVGNARTIGGTRSEASSPPSRGVHPGGCHVLRARSSPGSVRPLSARGEQPVAGRDEQPRAEQAPRPRERDHAPPSARASHRRRRLGRGGPKSEVLLASMPRTASPRSTGRYANSWDSAAHGVRGQPGASNSHPNWRRECDQVRIVSGAPEEGWLRTLTPDRGRYTCSGRNP